MNLMSQQAIACPMLLARQLLFPPFAMLANVHICAFLTLTEQSIIALTGKGFEYLR